ncbi:F-box/LRR-repeat protein 5-like [Littorina saxatilis]|uniref:F-box domain-containing protein n=1 Tax=Littorina saxatilis TaxID=31220 RepID=A0AAN9GAS0_9CAEN
MAPNYPDEVDVFSVPHSRMKQLVHKYLDMVTSTNFSDVGRMACVLEKLCHTFNVFKAHEQIENRFIMRRLKEKLLSLDITDAAVCNCHSDNRLTEMLSLVLEGYRWTQRSKSERIKYGMRLRHALEDFTKDFIPHMKEEEEVFQPMLVEYFTYDELKQLKAKVIQQHQEKIDEEDNDEKCLPECDSDKEEEHEEEASPADQLPTEVMMKILSHLSPRDLARCAQVSQRWNQLALDPFLWPAIHPVQWAAGDWSFHPHVEDEEEAEKKSVHKGEEDCYYVDDEDADKDESSDSESSDGQPDTTMQQVLREVRIISGLVKHVLPRVGEGVQLCNLAHSRGISSSLVHKVLKLCPNLTTLNLAHTKITDAAFKEYGMKGGTGRLQHLDLSSCENITDNTLRSLAGSQTSTNDPVNTPRLSCKGKNNIGTTFVELSRSHGTGDADYALQETDSVIGQDLCYTNLDPFFTDLPPELCEFDCLGVGQETASRRSDSGGNNTPSAAPSCCSVKRTRCCSSGGVEGGETKSGYCGSNVGDDGDKRTDSGDKPHALHGLTHLSLNSCYRITDEGLRVLSERGGLPLLQHLDLSGCLNLTGEGVAWLVDTCQSLDHAFLFYCDNIYPDPYPATASGCRNLECGARFCCRSGD